MERRNAQHEPRSLWRVQQQRRGRLAVWPRLVRDKAVRWRFNYNCSRKHQLDRFGLYVD